MQTPPNYCGALKGRYGRGKVAGRIGTAGECSPLAPQGIVAAGTPTAIGASASRTHGNPAGAKITAAARRLVRRHGVCANGTHTRTNTAGSRFHGKTANDGVKSGIAAGATTSGSRGPGNEVINHATPRPNNITISAPPTNTATVRPWNRLGKFGTGGRVKTTAFQETVNCKSNASYRQQLQGPPLARAPAHQSYTDSPP